MTAAAGRWTVAAVSGVLALAMLVQAGLFRRDNAITFDETYYLSISLEALLERDFSGFHGEQVSPLPILLAYWPLALDPAARARQLAVSTDHAHWRGRVGDPPLVARARLTNIMLSGIPLMLVVYLWLLRERGLGAAALGAGMCAFSPTVIAHGSLATTDACGALTVLLALAALAARAMPAPRALALLGVALGFALAAKYSAAFLVPVVVLVLLRRDSAALPSRVLRLFAVAAIAVVVCWAVYGFAWAAPDPVLAGQDGVPFPALALHWRPAPVAGLQVLFHESGAIDQFFMGRRSRTGWWDYFPVAMALKSTPAELALVVLVVVLLRRAGARSAGLWLFALLSCVLCAAATSLNIGQRHVLAAYPLLFLLAADRVFAAAPPRTAALAAGILLAAQVGSAVAIAPRQLSYFNALAGGPDGGYRYLVDSNLDWGQDLSPLPEALARQGCERVALVYFGTAAPEAYGFAPTRDGAQCVAISATPLQGVGVPGDVLAPFRLLKPAGRAGHSIFIYDAREVPQDVGGETISGVFRAPRTAEAGVSPRR